MADWSYLQEVSWCCSEDLQNLVVAGVLAELKKCFAK